MLKLCLRNQIESSNEREECSGQLFQKLLRDLIVAGSPCFFCPAHRGYRRVLKPNQFQQFSLMQDLQGSHYPA